MNKKNQNHIELLEDLISIPSFSGKENKSADRIENWFKENGIKCSRYKNNIYAFNKYYPFHPLSPEAPIASDISVYIPS